jgi:hypothetical protein
MARTGTSRDGHAPENARTDPKGVLRGARARTMCTRYSAHVRVRLSNSLYESRIRKSIRNSDVGFCWDLTFVTHPTFVSLAVRLFRNGKRKYLFSTFGNESPIRKSNPETKVLLYRRNENRNEVRIRKSQTNKQTVARMGPGPFQRR